MDKKNNVVAIIQARIGSTRLPDKVLKDIEGKPMLWHVVNRIKHSKNINKIVIATTKNKNDTKIVDFCKLYDIEFYRGSEEDVLDRYYQAAKLWQADIIVRITSDCPLIDPQVVDKVIVSYLENKDSLNGASNAIKRTYPRGLGVEVVSFNTLKRIWREAIKDYQREHVTIYMYENTKDFKILNVENNKNLSYLRWTVDEKKDLELVREIYKSLYNRKKIFLMNDTLDLLEKKPHIMEINKDVKQKKIIK